MATTNIKLFVAAPNEAAADVETRLDAALVTFGAAATVVSTHVRKDGNEVFVMQLLTP